MAKEQSKAKQQPDFHVFVVEEREGKDIHTYAV